MIMREINDPRLTGFPSITRVKVSEDLAVADVFFTVMGTPGHQQAALNALKHSAGLMRTRLTKSLSIRQAPFLRFHLDDQLRREMEVLEAINRAKRELDEREANQHDDDPEAGDGQTSLANSAGDTRSADTDSGDTSLGDTSLGDTNLGDADSGEVDSGHAGAGRADAEATGDRPTRDDNRESS